MQVYVSFTPTGTASTNDWVEIAGAQLTAGKMAAWERLPMAMQLQRCQRFYEAGQARFDGYTVTGGGYTGVVWYKVTKRTAPVPAQTNTGNIGFGATPSTLQKTFGGAYDTVDGFYSYRAATGTGHALFAETWTANARL